MLWTMYDCDGQRKYLIESEREAFLKVVRLEVAERNVAERNNAAVGTFCWIIAVTGCSISEALALTSKNIDFKAGQVIVASLKKRGKREFRAIPLPSELLQALTEVIKETESEERRSGDLRLWPWSRMTGYRRICEMMQKAGITGLQATPKGLRHGFGVSAIQSNVPLNLVQYWLGHTDLATTTIYASTIGSRERKIASRMWGDSAGQ